VYQVGAPDGSYTNIVAKIVLLRWTNWIPQPDSLGIHHRSLWSVEYEAPSAGKERPTATTAIAAKR
jgi:hypothetical protein